VGDENKVVRVVGMGVAFGPQYHSELARELGFECKLEQKIY